MASQNPKTAIITGGSRGIGKAAALLLAENGYNICISYNKNRDKALEVIKQAQKHQVKAIAVKADLSVESQIMEMFNQIDNELGTLSALVNNAAISGGIKAIEDIDFQYLENIYKTNVFSTFICCREAIKRMKTAKIQGSIVNISSLSAKNGGFKMSAYASSKAAVNNLTIGLAKEAAEYNIRINAVSPGVIDTDTHSNISNERRQHLNNSIALKRMGQPEEVAQLILWLLSDKASYITGSILPITGGKS